jgi:hypothetical protein
MILKDVQHLGDVGHLKHLIRKNLYLGDEKFDLYIFF